MILGNNSLVEVEKELTEFKEHHRREGFQAGKEILCAAVKSEILSKGNEPVCSEEKEYTEGFLAGMGHALSLMNMTIYFHRP